MCIEVGLLLYGSGNLFFKKKRYEPSFTNFTTIQYAATPNYIIHNSVSKVKTFYSKFSLSLSWFICRFSKLWNNMT